MQTIAQLSEDLTCLHCLIQHDPATEPPLADLYAPAFVALMLDVTGLNPLPQPGWTAANVVKDSSGQVTAATFSAPPTAPAPDLPAQLTNLMRAYINRHYDPPTQSDLIMEAVAQIEILINPASTAADKAQATAVVAALLSARTWINSIIAYSGSLAAQLAGGAAWESLDLDFAAHFDASDPHISLVVLLAG